MERNNNNNVLENTSVVIVGAGPAGIATSALLNSNSVRNIVFEKEDCCASLWKRRSYDRLSLHLAKEYCSLPLMSHGIMTSTFMSKDAFIDYVDKYVAKFDVNPRYYHTVDSAFYNQAENKWKVTATRTRETDEEGPKKEYTIVTDFLVIATGENSQAIVPKLPGMETFRGVVFHTCNYTSGEPFKGKDVLVVGCGNSGMEISNDLVESGAHTSIVVRSELHVLSRQVVRFAMLLLKYLPVRIVDRFVSFIAKFYYSDLSSYGIHRPKEGPFSFKALTGKTPVIDRGTIQKIRSKKLKVFPGVEKVENNVVEFKNGVRQHFDVIVMATGYRSVVHNWLKDYKFILDDNDKPKGKFPNHWKGENGVYCVGFSGRGLPGISSDSEAVAYDIARILKAMKAVDAAEMM